MSMERRAPQWGPGALSDSLRHMHFCYSQVHSFDADDKDRFSSDQCFFVSDVAKHEAIGSAKCVAWARASMNNILRSSSPNPCEYRRITPVKNMLFALSFLSFVGCLNFAGIQSTGPAMQSARHMQVLAGCREVRQVGRRIH